MAEDAGYDYFGTKNLYATTPGGRTYESKWHISRVLKGVVRDTADPEAWSRGEGTLTMGNGMLIMNGTRPRYYIYDVNSTTKVWDNTELTVYGWRGENITNKMT